MISIVSSTNRNNSNTLKVAQYYQKILTDLGKSNQIIDLQNIPEDYLSIGMYGTSGQNDEFNKLRELVALTDKFIFIIPEYNGSFPGILKLFIDGLPYPNCVKGKTAALCGLSGGPIGGLLALSHFTDILNYLNCNVLAIKPRIANISKEFEDQEFKNDFTKNIIHEQITQLINI